MAVLILIIDLIDGGIIWGPLELTLGSEDLSGEDCQIKPNIRMKVSDCKLPKTTTQRSTTERSGSNSLGNRPKTSTSQLLEIQLNYLNNFAR